MDSRMWRSAAVAALAGAGLAGCGITEGVFRHRSDLVVEPSPCVERRFEVYFADGQARLTEAARQVIGMTATQLRGCDIRRVQVLGLADAHGGTPTTNQTLSERRALTVADALTAAGWPAPTFDVSAVGEAGAVTDDGAREPMRRRTEVVVDAVPRR